MLHLPMPKSFIIIDEEDTSFNVHIIQFPSNQVGLPVGVENLIEAHDNQTVRISKSTAVYNRADYIIIYLTHNNTNYMKRCRIIHI
ncbi:hypothetical protein Lal_00034316 [Lupinus albus]|nr:hypothetical protein Lal_00034316 [Lupinus albus]